MLQKLRSREPIDLPVEKWHHSSLLMAIFVGVAFLFVLLPALGALGVGLKGHAVGIVLGIASAFAALLVAAALSRRKPLPKRRG